MPFVPTNTFPKTEKLKSRKQIDMLFLQGKSFFASPVKCYYKLTSLDVDELRGFRVDKLGSYVKSVTAEVKGELPTYPQTSNPEPETLTPKLYTQAIVNYKPQTINIKTGVSVSKRNFKKAVDRNRIKRLLREAYRIHKNPLIEKVQDEQMQLEVFFVFTDKAIPSFALVEEKMKYCIRRLGKIVEGGT